MWARRVFSKSERAKLAIFRVEGSKPPNAQLRHQWQVKSESEQGSQVRLRSSPEKVTCGSIARIRARQLRHRASVPNKFNNLQVAPVGTAPALLTARNPK